jgi:hypothetical protein
VSAIFVGLPMRHGPARKRARRRLDKATKESAAALNPSEIL